MSKTNSKARKTNNLILTRKKKANKGVLQKPIYGSKRAPVSKACSKKKSQYVANIPYNRSFASSDKAKFWSKKNPCQPKDVYKAKKEKYLFDCKECGHEISQRLDTIQSGSWCGFCSGRAVCGEMSCEKCLEKSFHSHPKAIFWSDDNKEKPHQVTKASSRKFKFNCDKCKHVFIIRLDLITKDRWCNFCANKKLCDNDDCEKCLNNSFASNEKSIFLSNKNQNPRNIFRSTNKHYNFICENGHKFKMSINHVTHGHWCPQCVHKTEQKLGKWLEETYDTVKHQPRYDWCKNGKSFLPFDFVLEDFKIIIELDGDQHFRQVSNWASPEKIQDSDLCKMMNAIKRSYTIIRVLQDDIWNDKYDWKLVLPCFVKKYAIQQVVFISTDKTKYDSHKNFLDKLINDHNDQYKNKINAQLTKIDV